MNGKQKNTAIITGIISAALIGLIIVQVFLLIDTYDQKQQEFNRSVVNALENVSRKIEVDEAVRKITLVTTDSTYLPPVPGNLQKNVTKIKTGKPAAVKNSVQVVAVSPNIKLHPDSLTKGKSYEFYHSTSDTSYVTDIQTSSGFSFSGTTDSGGKSTSYSFSVTPGAEAKVYTNSGGTHRFYFESIDSTKKKQIITDVFDQLFIAEDLPIEQRINRDTLDSLIRAELLQKNIELEYIFGVSAGNPDSLLLVRDSSLAGSLAASPLKAALFPADILSSPKNLIIYFPDQDFFVIRQVAPLMLFSLLFLGILAVAFIYILSVIKKQKRISAHLVDFINNMTHEFKTPISTISLAAEAIGKQEVAADASRFSRYRNIIADENTRMKGQVDKILQMAVIEGGNANMELTPLPLNQLISEAAANFKVRTDEAGGTVTLDLKAGSDIISGDKVHITNIIHNLMDNSLKYSRGNPAITISTFNFGNEIVVKFSDNGMGIPEKDINHVFDKYYRVSSGNVHDVKGFGLGLSYVKLIVTAHKGKISLTSEYGSGTQVIITFAVS